jgi:hypothetical protein
MLRLPYAANGVVGRPKDKIAMPASPRAIFARRCTTRAEEEPTSSACRVAQERAGADPLFAASSFVVLASCGAADAARAQVIALYMLRFGWTIRNMAKRLRADPRAVATSPPDLSHI